jgi:hypothetical protein
MDNTILTTMKPEELKSFISDAIREEFGRLPELNHHKQDDEELINDIELSKRLGKSRVTLYKYRLNGIIPFIRVGGRILYNWKDVYESLNHVEQDSNILGR